MVSTKILLIGQGIAGTVLAWRLLRRGVTLHIADGNLPGGASVAAAGIINPVTGKRFVKSWRFEEFFPAARRTYQEMEAALGISIWQEKPIVRLLATPEEANDWAVRCSLFDYSDYLGELPDAGDWGSLIKPGFRAGAIRQAARVNFEQLLPAFRAAVQKQGFLAPGILPERSDNQPVFLEREIDYQEIEKLASAYDYIIFCEGYRAEANPFFPKLPWQIAKGEALIIRFNDLRTASIVDMLKKTMTLVPLGNGTFWAGGSYQWHYPDLHPSASERAFILHHLQEMLAAPFEVIDHIAGVRPTVKDRRPFLGRSPENPKVFMFNGMGTKGALLAPFWAEHLVQHMLEGALLAPEVDIQRVRGQ